MAGFALYEHRRETHTADSETQLSIVLHSSEQDIEALTRTLSAHLRENLAPSKVVLFGLQPNRQFIASVLEINSPFMIRLSKAWGSNAENKCFGVLVERDGKGFEPLLSGAAGYLVDPQREADFARQMTSQSIFKSRKCLQVAPRGIHFSKTSGAHSDSFIRASNALVRSGDTLTLAYWLQSFLSQTTQRILVDTSAIASLVYAGCAMAVSSGSQAQMPVIDSFQSYEGLSDEDLSAIDQTLFVISASSSGNLAREALQRRVPRNRLLTVFLLANEQNDQDSLCNVAKTASNPDGLALIESYKPDDCSLCKGGSSPIQIGGDLFLTALPRSVGITLVKKHLPEEQYKLLGGYAGIGLFRVHKRIGDRTSEISVDLGSLLDAEETAAVSFRESWDRMLRRHVPANVSHLISPEYPWSSELLKTVAAFGRQYLDMAKVVQKRGVAVYGSDPVPEGAALVVTPCIDNAIEMMGISRDLRTVVPGGNVIYFAPFVRAKTPKDIKSVCTNLTFGDRGANTHSLHKIHDLLLPDDRAVDPWESELLYLTAVSDWLEAEDLEIPVELTRRRSVLANASAQGMTSDLFWPAYAGEALQIRSNFVLLPTRDGKQSLSQADIFVVVSCLLNNLRHSEGPDRLRCSEYERRVLAPDNFVRFNDGVIQAAILRASSGDELNYVATHTESFSNQLRDLLMKMIDGAQEQTGEALSEFVLALGMGRIRLDADDIRKVIEKIEACREQLPTIVVCVAQAIANGVFGSPRREP
ncbi:hypothetical protein [Caballeronia sordidicola]|uniref:hypothetical protein n=1 Tax=Caballeronia sordidicola TaxID=196367 RepID=UPI0004D0133C|nr:hypothetical protein [Caballeronia sordidicola]